MLTEIIAEMLILLKLQRNRVLLGIELYGNLLMLAFCIRWY